MHKVKIIVPPAVISIGLLLCTSSTFGTPEYAKKEKKACTVCNTKVAAEKADMVKNLNSTGTCYKDDGHSLEKCGKK